MSTRTIVILQEENGSDYGEIKDFDTLEDAERHIESLLEKGFEHKSIRLLEGSEREFVVRNRPVVSALPAVAPAQPDALVDAAIEMPGLDDTVETLAAPPAEAWVEEPELIPVGASAGSKPYMKDGVRFSTIFGRA